MTDPEPTAQVVTLRELLASSSGPGPVWTSTTADLNVNLISFAAGQGVPEHVNDEVDVLIVAVQGEGIVTVDGAARPMTAGQACLIPKGASRMIRSEAGGFAYLTCHRRRGGLWPVDDAPGRPES